MVRAEAMYKPKQAKGSNPVVGAGEEDMKNVFNISMAELAESINLFFCSYYSGDPVLCWNYSMQEFEKKER